MTTTGPSNTRQLDVDPTVPERYGDYELIRPIASGGMAEIFLARKLGVRGFQKLVVVKRIRRELINQNMVGMFLDEAHVAAKLDHPHLVLIHDLGEADGTYFIAMEYLKGQSLRQLHTRLIELNKVVPPHFWVQLLDYALDGLHFAHELRNDAGELVGLVHRDFTPSNIMITYNGVVKLIDFGVAHVTEPSNHETQVGAIKGKVAYLSPEQCLGKRVDRRTDIFAAGAVLWEMLSGRQLFTGPSDPSIIVSIVQGEIPPAGPEGQPVEPFLQDILNKALSRDLNARYQTVAEMREDIRQYLRLKEKVDASDIGAVMMQIFDTERAVDERLIRDSASGSGPVRGGSRSGSQSGVSRSGSASSSAAAGQVRAAVAAPAGHARVVRIAIGAAATFALSAAVWRFYPSKPAPVPTPMVETAGAQPHGATPAGNTPTAANTPTGTAPTAANTPTGNTPTGTAPGGTAPTGATPTGAAPTAANTPTGATPTGATQSGVAVAPTGASTTPTKERKSSSPDGSQGYGTLDFDTRPYTSVYLGRKKLGDTPMLGVRVPAGTLNLTLINDEAGIHETFTVTVPKDGHAFKKLKL